MRYYLESKNPAMQKVITAIREVARTRLSVLLCGETGTGKNEFARLIHDSSAEKDGPFVVLDGAQMHVNLVESEVFGHERGAFTGATEGKIGLLELANRGSLFFNEIENLSLEIQAKLLEVLENRTFRRVGGTQELRSDFRLISATNQDIPHLFQTGRFREDLYHRINELSIVIPPLREWREDILPLAEYFLRTFDGKADPPMCLSMVVREMFMSYSWPGNVRELRNVIKRAVHFCRSAEIMPENISLDFRLAAQLDQAKQHRWSLEQVERRHISAILEETQGNLTEAARILGIDRTTLKRKIRTYQLKETGGE